MAVVICWRACGSYIVDELSHCIKPGSVRCGESISTSQLGRTRSNVKYVQSDGCGGGLCDAPASPTVSSSNATVVCPAGWYGDTQAECQATRMYVHVCVFGGGGVVSSMIWMCK